MKLSLLLVTGLLVACGQTKSIKESTAYNRVEENDATEQQNPPSDQAEDGATSSEPSNEGTQAVAASSTDQDQASSEGSLDVDVGHEIGDYNHEAHYCQWFPKSYDPEVDKLQVIGFDLVEAAKAIGILEAMETADPIQRQQLTSDLEKLTVDVAKFYWDTCQDEAQMNLTGIFQGIIDLLTGAWGLLATTLLGAIDLASYTLSQGVTIIHDSVYEAFVGTYDYDAVPQRQPWGDQ